MSEFKVDARKISKVWTHPNADRLDLAQVEGLSFQFVVGRKQFRVGDVVVYIPVDSCLTDELTAFLGLTGKLSGKSNRVRTVKLQKEISQGLVVRFLDLGYKFDCPDLKELINGDIRFNIHFAGNEISKISESFYIGQSGELIAYIDSSRFLSFALNGQNAAQKLGLTKGDRVEIERFDN